MFFSVITKTLNWEILTTNLVTFKRRNGVKDEKFYYYEGSLKIQLFRKGGFMKNEYAVWNCLKRRAWIGFGI